MPESAELNNPDRRLVKRVEYTIKGHSVADIVDWCVQRGLDPTKVRHSGGGHFEWETLETDEERDRRLKHWREQDERQLKWEREMYAKLKEKYGA